MLHSEKTLKGFPLRSRDGDVGSIKDLYFDDDHWAIRYLVADTGNWLVSRKVLISPYSLGAVEMGWGSVDVNLTQKQIEDSPSLDSDKPVSWQFEELYYGFYGWPAYWGGPYVWGAYPILERDPEHWTRISSLTTGRGSFAISSSTPKIGGRERRSCCRRSGWIA